MDLLKDVEQYNKRHRRKKYRQRLVTMLGCIVVFCTTYALILPAITLEKEVYCELKEHTHTRDCYVQLTDETSGQNNENTVSDGDNQIDTHNTVSDSDNQVDAHDTVSDGDNQEITEYALTCTKEEGENHEHTFLCYGNWELVCEQEEHVHKLICYSDVTADVETAEDWEAAFADLELTGEWSQDILAIAKTQLGYIESTQNYIVLEDEETVKGYTRYGAWYGDPYGDWDAMFVSFCLYYAGVEEMPLDSDCADWAAALSSEEYNLYESAGNHAVQAGELIFFDQNSDGIADHVGITAELIFSEDNTSSQIKVIEGDSDRLVRYMTYDQTDGQIIGYSLLPGAALPARPEKVQHIIDLIDAMPGADEIDAKLAEYEEAEDYEGEEAYYTQVVQRVCEIYQYYMELTDAEKALVTNADKLLELEYIWSAVTLIDEITSDRPTTVTAASTSDFIDLNLYDYGSNLNTLYSSNTKYPGFQWNGGAYMKSTSFDRHVVDYIDFGNSMITDLTYGSSGSGTANGYSNNRKIVGNKGGDINKLDVSDYGITNRPIGMSLNDSITDTDNDVLSRTLGSDGYPALTDGTSLSYLFTNGTYATKKNSASIDGLFQQDTVSGEYHYNSRTNHAQYSNNKFTLYNQIITPNFIVYPFGNFLPFNDITNGSNATQVSKITKLGSSGYMQHVINDLVYASDYSTNPTKQQLVDMLAKYRNDLQGGDGETNTGDSWATWSAKDAIVDYFEGDNSDSDNPSDDTSLITDALLKKMYNIDFDVETNFFFGMDMSMNFMQPKGGMTGNDTNSDGESDYPMIFYFTGDDDVWVYIDGVLFLDLSGIHRHVGGEIDFVNGKVNYYYLDSANTGDVSTSPYQTYTFAEILAAAGKSTSGLNTAGTFKDYTTHQFKFYYMERGSGSSVCRLNFNFPLLRQNTISVSKELSNNSTVLGNPDFMFQVLKADSNGNKTDELFIGANVEYKVYNADNTVLRTSKTDANGIITLKAGERAEFTGITEDQGKYYVRELLDSTVNGQYGQITVSGESTTTKNNITIGNDTFTGLESPVKDMSNGSTAFRFDNKVDTDKLGTLTIKKVVEEYDQSSANNDTFTFHVTLDGTPLSEDITLRKGETATIPNILAGTTFTVQETSGSAEGYTVLYCEDPEDTAGGNVVTTDGNMASGTIIYSATVGVIVTNTEKGATVTIPGSKSLSAYDDATHDYTFTLEQVTDSTGTTPTENGTNLTSTVTVLDQNVPFHFVLSYRQYQLTSLPRVYYYRIYESDLDANTLDNHQVYIAEVTISDDGTDGLKAELTKMWYGTMNTEKQIDTASLTELSGTNHTFTADFVNTLASDLIISKQVAGNASVTQTFTFEITLESADSAIAPGDKAYSAIKTTDGTARETTIQFTGNTATIALKSGESFQILGLPYGTGWTISETNSDGYKVTYSQTGSSSLTDTLGNSASGTIVLGGNSVAFTNSTSYVLPETGGSGTDMYIAGGLLLSTLSMLLLLYNKKKKGNLIMKKMKKLASLVLAVVMVFAMSITSFAAGDTTNDDGSNVTTGTITITNAVVGQTYTIYQLLDLESYNADANAYSYKATAAWSTFINSDAVKGVYVNVDDQGYVTWVEGADAAAFAQLAKEYAKDNSITGQDSKEAEAVNEGDTTTTVEFTGLDLGYYLVDSTLGALCSLDTTNPSVQMLEKNEVPTIDKEVQEDSTGSWGDENDADIGQTVNFKTTVHAKKGAENYIVHDKMSEGLTLDTDSIAVTVGETILTLNTDYTVAFSVTHDSDDSTEAAEVCDFEIIFSESYLDTITDDTDIVITYSAVLNDKAVISPDANTNDTRLEYGDENYTQWDQTETYTFRFELVKTDTDDNLLTGATFELYDAETGGNKIALVKEEDGTYRVATEDEKSADNFESAIIEAGQAVIKGLDGNTTYWLEEIEAPDGYNKLPARVAVAIAEENLDATVTDGVWEDGGVKVENKTGTELPSTGGMGTTLFYILGGILVVAAAVLLITKKRMSSIEN